MMCVPADAESVNLLECRHRRKQNAATQPDENNFVVRILAFAMLARARVAYDVR